MFLEAPYKTFLEFHFDKNGIELNDETIKFIEKICKFQEAEHGTRVGRDAVTIKEDDDEFAAESLKFYNGLMIDNRHTVEMILKGIVGIGLGTVISFSAALIFIALDFYNKSNYKFSKSDTKVLTAIFYLGDTNFINFSIDSLKEKYGELFNKELTDERIKKSFELFHTLRVIKKIGVNTYQVREKISYVRV